MKETQQTINTDTVGCSSATLAPDGSWVVGLNNGTVICSDDTEVTWSGGRDLLSIPTDEPLNELDILK